MTQQQSERRGASLRLSACADSGGTVMLGATAIESSRSLMPLDAAHPLVESLAAYGVDRIFCVPGESSISAFAKLPDRQP